MNIDVFNGDADGLCALIQLRLAQPCPAQQLVSGVKRDIALLDKVTASSGDQLTVLDIALEKNHAPLQKLLAQNIPVFYVDHHFPGEIPHHPGLTALIDTAADTCTSLLINRHLQGRYPAWAVTGAFGDNLAASARQAALPLRLTEPQLGQLQQLGICLNYNAYGDSVDDLHFAPPDLYRQLVDYQSPLEFIAAQPDIFAQLQTAYADDLQRANSLLPLLQTEKIAVYELADEKWCRRVSGVWNNQLANRHPQRAHALISLKHDGSYQISVRAPLNNPTGADTLCSRFPSGGGRKAAAGINHLPAPQLDAFIAAFRQQYS